MSDAIMLIQSNSYGNPVAPGSTNIGHWVRVSDNPNMFCVNQLSGDGQYIHEDCGEADIVSALHDRGISADDLTIEHKVPTPSQGTWAWQLVTAFVSFNIQAHAANQLPAPNYIMNPLGGRIIPPSEFDAYAKAFLGVVVIIDTPLSVTGEAMTDAEQAALGGFLTTMGQSLARALAPLGITCNLPNNHDEIGSAIGGGNYAGACALGNNAFSGSAKVTPDESGAVATLSKQLTDAVESLNANLTALHTKVDTVSGAVTGLQQTEVPTANREGGVR